MIFVALSEAADKNQLILVDGGMCRFHKRRDGVVVVREIIVLKAARRRSVGRSMIDEVIRRHPGAVLEAKCPAEFDSNSFWSAVGFESVGFDERCQKWRKSPSSGAQTETSSTAE